MKRRLSSSDSGDAAAGDALPSPASEPLSVTSEQLSELVKSVLSRDVLSSLLSQAALSLAPKRFGNVGFGGNDESNVNAFLHQKLGKDNLSRRAGPRGTKLTYIESCKAIELANQAFGFNGWSCHILECKEEYVRDARFRRESVKFSTDEASILCVCVFYCSASKRTSDGVSALARSCGSSSRTAQATRTSVSVRRMGSRISVRP
jgi:hypothetical protein